MNREDARRDLNNRPLSDFIPLQRSKKAGANMYICPVCGSGTGRNGTGAFHIYPNTNRVTCYSGNCFTEKGEDTLGALKIIWQCEETEVLKRAGYNLDAAEASSTPRKAAEPQRKVAPVQPEEDHTLFYRQCHETLKKDEEALAYLHGRGISDESIERFNLGFCREWKHSRSGPTVSATKRIIIPRTKGSYMARRIDKPTNKYEEQYVKQIQGKQTDLFNSECLQDASIAFICEGELDAISLYQAGAAAVVGIGTITNAARFLEVAKKHPDTVYIIALDNDKDKPNGMTPGKDAQKKLADEMQAVGLQVLNVNPADIYGTEKDGNDAFIKEPERLKKVVAYLQKQAQDIKATIDEERAEDLKKRTGEGMLDSFLLSVTDEKARTFEPIKTEITDIDRALEGGFIRKTLVTLGAPPAMGKTALAQWIFENMARNGHDVLYINLEMSRDQLLARSLSRLVWKYEKEDVSSLDVLRGYSWTSRQKELITKTAARYREEIAPHFIYNPEGVTNELNSILSVMNKETLRLKAAGRPEPLICIDYLQLIDSGERDAVEGMKNVIFRLKDFAKANNTVVFVIVANNRASNRAGTVDMESGRDTSAIEYSGDIMLGLSYTAIEDRRTYECGTDSKGNARRAEYDLETIRRLKKEAYERGEAVPPVCNELSLKVLKSRFTESERRANLIFDGKHSTFNQVTRSGVQDESAGEWVKYTGDKEDLPFPWDD